MRETIKAALETDATLEAILTGGIHAGTEISRQLTPDAFDAASEIKPCALVKIERETQWGPYDSDAALSARTYVVIYAYERQGYTHIDPALDRIRTLLHRAKLGSGTWQIAWADDSDDLMDEGLACAMRYSRYVVTRLK
jgi:hypothetical protein